MRRYLLFDAGRATCHQLARAIEEAAGGKLEAASLRKRRAERWLDRAYPAGWEHQPYLVTVDGERVQAYAGPGMALRLGWLLGPRQGWRVWNLGRRYDTFLSSGTNASPHTTSRRQFLKAGLAATLTAVAGRLGFQPVPVAHACIPCEDCGVNCQYGAVCLRLRVCGNPSLYDMCDLLL